MLVQEIFRDILELIGVITLDEAPEPSDLQKCKRHVNLMLDSWSGRRMLLQATVQESFTLATNKRQYTIGVGADFNTSKPVRLVSAFVRDASNVDHPVTVLPDQDSYDAIDDKLLSNGRPEVLYYDPGVTQQAVQTGIISLHYIRDTTYTLFINSQKYLSEFNKLTDVVAFPPAYFRALVMNGACELWHPMGRKGPIPPWIVKGASDSLTVVMNINGRTGNMRTDLPGVSGTPDNNPLTGGWMS